MLHVAIKSFNRPRMLAHLLSDLALEAGAGHKLCVTVWDDASTVSMLDAKSLCAAQPGWTWHDLPKNHGKHDAWKLHNGIYASLPKQGNFFFFDDDMRLCERFFARALERWGTIPNKPTRATLHFLVDDSRAETGCWTAVKPKPVNKLVRRTQWVDGSFMCDGRMLDAIGRSLKPITAARWRRDPSRSTGVGEQLSRRLHEGGFHLYQTAQSLLVHVGVTDSRYNPAERRARPLRTVRFIDGELASRRLLHREPVICSIATQKSRLATLEKVVAALLPQVDRLCVYLNDHKVVPGFLKKDKIGSALGADYLVDRGPGGHAGDLGDAGKFFWAPSGPHFRFTCDDDIAYPPDYVSVMLGAIEDHARKAAVGVHGVRLRSKIDSYYKDRVSVHFAAPLDADAPQHLLGTGTLAFFSETIAVSLDDFPERNMADISFGLLAQKHGVPLIAIARRARWLTALPTAQSIYQRARQSDARQTQMVNSRVWKLPASAARRKSRPAAQAPKPIPHRRPLSPAQQQAREKRLKLIIKRGW